MFTKELSTANNIYDIMAISYIHMIEDKNFDLNSENNNSFVKIIFSKYIEDKVYNPCNAFNNLKESLISLSRSHHFTSVDFFNLIIEIDSSEIYKYSNSLYFDDTFKTYESLNILFKDKIRIYPILLSNYREELNSIYIKDFKDNYLRDRKIYNSSSINSKLSNYIVYPINEYLNYNIIFHELIEYEDFINHIYEKGEIKIALFPLTSLYIHELLNIKYTERKTFYIDSMDTHIEENIIQRCKTFINNLDDDIDFLIFPEMTMSKSIIDSIKNTIFKKNIPFVFFGSECLNGDNICRVFYENEEIFKYYKKVPFKLKYSKTEFLDIIKKCSDKKQLGILNSLFESHDFKHKILFQEKINKENNIHIIDINKLGRILTYICKDIDDDFYMNIAKMFQGDFIILPACNPSDDLSNGASHLSERYHCTTIMCNTCSSLCNNKNTLDKNIESKKNIGFIITPSKNVTTRSHKKIYYSFDESCKKCNTHCGGRIFTINIEELCIENNSISLNVSEIRR